MSELNDKMYRAMTLANTAMIKALAATHPDHDQLRAAFSYYSEGQIASALATQTDEDLWRLIQMHADELIRHATRKAQP